MIRPFPSELLDKPTLWKFIVAAFRRNKTWAVTTFLLRCGTLSTNITWPLFTKFIVDYLVIFKETGQVDWELLTYAMIVGFVGWFGTDLPDIAARLISGRTIAEMRAEIRLLIMQDMYAQSQQFYHDRFSGSVSTSMRDLSEAVSDIANDIVFQFLPALILALSLCYIFFEMHWSYIVLMTVWTLVQAAVIFFTKRGSEEKSRTYANYRSELFGKIIDSLSNHLAVRSFGAEAMEQRHIIRSEEEVINARVKVVTYTQKIELFTAFVEVAFVFFGFFSVYMWLFQQGKSTAGDFMFLIGAIWGLMQAVNILSERMLWLYEQVGVGQEAIRKILVPHSVQNNIGANMLEVTKPTIEVRNLGFAYHKERPILKNISLTIKSGEKIGLVGYSGAGKTTFVHMLMRFYDPTIGQIFIQGKDITTVTQESLRDAIALIPQDISLFHRTLRENIGIANLDANDEKIIEASKLAGAHDFIMQLPQKYETLVGERGIKLSGGQRQRIAIARAFLKAAPILILDEATSALDSKTENEIQDALEKVMAGRTTLVIAHRLSTLRRMDRILVFDQGEIVESGTHKHLLALKGRYAKMWAMQAGGFLPEQDPAHKSGKDEEGDLPLLTEDV